MGNAFHTSTATVTAAHHELCLRKVNNMNVNEPCLDGRPRSALQTIKGGRGIGFNYAVATGAYREDI